MAKLLWPCVDISIRADCPRAPGFQGRLMRTSLISPSTVSKNSRSSSRLVTIRPRGRIIPALWSNPRTIACRCTECERYQGLVSAHPRSHSTRPERDTAWTTPFADSSETPACGSKVGVEQGREPSLAIVIFRCGEGQGERGFQGGQWFDGVCGSS